LIDPFEGCFEPRVIPCESEVLQTGDADVELINVEEMANVLVGEMDLGEVENLLAIDCWKPWDAEQYPSDVIQRIASERVPPIEQSLDSIVVVDEVV
jgi:hypothetical protein